MCQRLHTQSIWSMLLLCFIQALLIRADSTPHRLGRVLLGGKFSLTENIENLALFDMDLNSTYPFYRVSGPNGRVYVIKYEPRCDFMVIGGSFSEVDGVRTGPLAFIPDVSKTDNHTWLGISGWDRNLKYGNWSEGAIVMSIVFAYKDVLNRCRPKLVVAGKFTKIAGIDNVNNIAILNTVDMTWDFLPSGGVNGIVGEYVKSAAYLGDVLYAGGFFKGYLKRYNVNTWQTVLQGQLDGPVSYILSQSSLVHPSNLIIGGHFNNPHKYLLKISANNINLSPQIKKTFNFQEGRNETSGIKKMFLMQDNLHLFGYFTVVLDADNSVHSSNHVVFNMEYGRLLSNNSTLLENIPQCGAPCLSPFLTCQKGSSVLVTREIEKMDGQDVTAAKYLTLVVDGGATEKSFRMELSDEDGDFDLVNSIMFMPSRKP